MFNGPRNRSFERKINKNKNKIKKLQLSGEHLVKKNGGTDFKKKKKHSVFRCTVHIFTIVMIQTTV